MSSKKHQSRSRPLHPKLWAKAKRKADKIYKVNSAYKSGYQVREYNLLGGKWCNQHGKEGNKNNNHGLGRWFAEKWRNQRGTEGYKHKNDIYRPTIRKTKQTPITMNELSKKQINKARKIKYKKGRVKKFSDIIG